MQIRVDVTGMEAEAKQSKQFPRLLREGLVELVEDSARRTMGKVKDVMPVDTGFARAIWGMFTPEHVVNHLKLAQSNRLGASIWRTSNGGLTHEQGAEIAPHNYINELNDGSSQQAPRMFLDAIAEQEAQALMNEVGQLVEEIF